MFEELCDRFFNYLAVEKGLSRNTLDAYSRDINRYLEYLSLQGIEDIFRTTASGILGFLALEKKRGQSAKSMARNMSAIRTFYRFLLTENVLNSDPLTNFQNPKAKKIAGGLKP